MNSRSRELRQAPAHCATTRREEGGGKREEGRGKRKRGKREEGGTPHTPTQKKKCPSRGGSRKRSSSSSRRTASACPQQHSKIRRREACSKDTRAALTRKKLPQTRGCMQTPPELSSSASRHKSVLSGALSGSQLQSPCPPPANQPHTHHGFLRSPHTTPQNSTARAQVMVGADAARVFTSAANRARVSHTRGCVRSGV